MGKIFKITTAAFVLFIMVSFSSTTASAAEKQTLTDTNEVMVTQGYTESGVYYEGYKETPSSLTITPTSTITPTPNIINTIHVERKVIYYAIISQESIPNPIPWSERVDSYTTYTGTLEWESIYWDYENNQTIVWYQGYLVGRI